MRERLGPFIAALQLLRTLAQLPEEARNPDLSPARPILLVMRAADSQLHLSRVLRLSRDRGQQQWPLDDGLAMVGRIGQMNDQAPLIIDQHNRVREQPAAFQIVCGEAAPTPLVLQFVVRIFDIPFVMPLKI